MAISTAEFEIVRRFAKERAAIVLEPGKEYLVESRLGALAKAEGIAVSDLIRRVHMSPTGPLAVKVTDALTTNETSFFRDVKPFEVLRSAVLPNLIARRGPGKALNIWCAAGSSGQEPYTIALVIREHFPELASWRVRIVSTDLSTEMVDRTAAGRYSQLEVGRGLPAPMLVKHFKRVGLDWIASDDLRRMVEPRQMNLAAAWPPLGRFDVVFLRNVLIYFDVATKRTILNRTRQLMSPDGYLFLGAAESPRGLDDGFVHLDGAAGGCYRIQTAERRAS